MDWMFGPALRAPDPDGSSSGEAAVATMLPSGTDIFHFLVAAFTFLMAVSYRSLCLQWLPVYSGAKHRELDGRLASIAEFLLGCGSQQESSDSEVPHGDSHVSGLPDSLSSSQLLAEAPALVSVAQASPACAVPPVAEAEAPVQAKAQSKGKGKGKGKPPAAPPPPAKSKQPSLIGGSVRDRVATIENVDTSPFEIKIRWTPLPSVDNTVFGEFRTEAIVEQDLQMLHAVFDKEPREERRPRAEPKAKPAMACILDDQRAHILGITLKRCPLPMEDLSQAVQRYDFSLGLDEETIDLLLKMWPTVDEQRRIMNFAAKDPLRSVEKDIRCLAVVPRSQGRLKIIRLARGLSSFSSHISEELRILTTACAQLYKSKSWRTVLATALQLGNYMNHGAAESVMQDTRGFTVQSLLESRKVKGASGVSLLHCVCAACMRHHGPDFVSLLHNELASIPGASRVSVSTLSAKIRQLENELKEVAAELQRYADVYDEPEMLFGPKSSIRPMATPSAKATSSEVSPQTGSQAKRSFMHRFDFGSDGSRSALASIVRKSLDKGRGSLGLCSSAAEKNFQGLRQSAAMDAAVSASPTDSSEDELLSPRIGQSSSPCAKRPSAVSSVSTRPKPAPVPKLPLLKVPGELRAGIRHVPLPNMVNSSRVAQQECKNTSATIMVSTPVRRICSNGGARETARGIARGASQPSTPPSCGWSSSRPTLKNASHQQEGKGAVGGLTESTRVQRDIQGSLSSNDTVPVRQGVLEPRGLECHNATEADCTDFSVLRRLNSLVSRGSIFLSDAKSSLSQCKEQLRTCECYFGAICRDDATSSDTFMPAVSEVLTTLEVASRDVKQKRWDRLLAPENARRGRCTTSPPPQREGDLWSPGWRRRNRSDFDTSSLSPNPALSPKLVPSRGRRLGRPLNVDSDADTTFERKCS